MRERRHNSLHSPCHREHINQAAALHGVAGLLEPHQIAHEAGWFTADIDHLVDAETDDLAEGLRIDTVAGRVEDDHVRFFGEVIHNLEDIAGNEFTISQVVIPALRRAASTASSTISTPTTFLAYGAIIWAMVPVPV